MAMGVVLYLKAFSIEPLLDVVQLAKKAPSKLVHQRRQWLYLHVARKPGLRHIALQGLKRPSCDWQHHGQVAQDGPAH